MNIIYVTDFIATVNFSGIGTQTTSSTTHVHYSFQLFALITVKPELFRITLERQI